MPKQEIGTEPIKHTKEQYLQSATYAERRDLLKALLEDGDSYSAEQVDRKVNEFLKKEAK